MYYAAQTRPTDSAINVGAYNGRPLVNIRAFGSVAEMRAELEKIWEGGDGYNLIRVSRKQVVGWYGSRFTTYLNSDIVCSEYDQ